MLILEINKLKKYYGDRLILDIDNLKIDSTDRIGIVGVNGVGKSTLLNIITGNENYDEGNITLYGDYAYLKQLSAEVREDSLDKKLCGELGIHKLVSENKSGGEVTKLKIVEAFSRKCELLIADEPTSNLDIESIEILEKNLKSFSGAILMVSHDRNLLDNICSKIIEVEHGRLKVYKGNYSDYISQKEHRLTRANFEYEEYTKEKKRLEKAVIEINQRATSMRSTPKRMGNSEARLHKRGVNKKQGKIEKASKILERRIEQLDVKEKPKESKAVSLDIQEVSKSHSKVLVEGRNLSKSFGNRVLFENASFKVPNGRKIALLGNNGTGKTTLINMILNRDGNIKVSPTAKIAYFNQKLSILNEEKSILDNVMELTSRDETFIRIVLSRLLIFREDVYKKVSVLSGGERVKVALAKILLQDANILILDEPTNYLDIKSQEALEELLLEYEGTILYVSHDRALVRNTADYLLILEDSKLITFNGSYDKYMESKEIIKVNDNTGNENFEEKLMVLQNELSMIMGKLCTSNKEDEKTALDKRYYEVLSEIKNLKCSF